MKRCKGASILFVRDFPPDQVATAHSLARSSPPPTDLQQFNDGRGNKSMRKEGRKEAAAQIMVDGPMVEGNEGERRTSCFAHDSTRIAPGISLRQMAVVHYGPYILG